MSSDGRSDDSAEVRGVQRLVLLAAAIAGRPLELSEDREAFVWTDGLRLYLPAAGAGPLLAPLVVQAALLAVGSLDPAVMMKLLGRRQHAARYVTLEARRACESLEGCLPRAVEAALQPLAAVALTTMPQDSLERAATDYAIPQRPDLLGLLRPRKVLAAGGAAMALSAIKAGLPKDKARGEQLDIPDVDDDDDADESKVLKLLSGPGSDNFISRFLRNNILNVGRGMKAESGEGGDDLAVGGQSMVREVGSDAQLAQRPPGLAEVEAILQPQRWLYPEWDHARERYRLDWTAVSEMDPSVALETAGLQDQPDPALQRSLARLGIGLETHRRLREGELLDLGALVDFAVARAAGNQCDERVYRARLRTAHELGVVVLLDASGSTGERNEQAQEIWDRQRHLAANLVRGLEAVGDRVAAYGFRSYGRQDVRFLRLKDFHSRFDGAAWRRLNALRPAGFTRLGAAVRHAVHLAQTEAGTRQRLLVLISDGLPYEDGYEGRQARQDVRKALEEAVNAGVGCVCLSVGSAANDEDLQELWGETSHLRIAEALALGDRAEPLMRAALRAALEGSHGGTRRRGTTTAVTTRY